MTTSAVTPPTSDEITAALAVLRRIPDTNSSISLAQIERLNRPIMRMAGDLIGWAQDDGNDYRQNTPAAVAEMLETMAEEHGLRITTDPEPGELIQFRLVRRAANGWLLLDASVSYEASQGGLDAATGDRASFADAEGCCPRIAAVRLLPEGGKA